MKSSSTTSTVLVVGLGNVGSRHERQRHNAGFMLLALLARRLNPHATPIVWKAQKHAETWSTSSHHRQLLLARPTTMMNRSGLACSTLLQRTRIQPDNMIVVHDDIDLPLAEIRAKVGGGHGGHNGLRSIIDHIGPSFQRLRIGIGRPVLPDNAPDRPQIRHQLVHHHVLSDFHADERTILMARLDAIAQESQHWLPHRLTQHQWSCGNHDQQPMSAPARHLHGAISDLTARHPPKQQPIF